MTVFSIPCETYVRLSHVQKMMPDDASIWFRSVRIDNGVAVASNRLFIVCENIGGPGGVAHITCDPVLVEACAREAPYKSTLTITTNDIVPHGVAQTTCGYTYPGNALVLSPIPNEFDKWRSIIPEKPATVARGAQYWDADLLNIFTSTSPSGRLIFEEFIDTNAVSIIRDALDYNWCGFTFWRRAIKEGAQPAPATRPSWLLL